MRIGRKLAILIGVATLAISAALPFMRFSPDGDRRTTLAQSTEHRFDAPLQASSTPGPVPTVAVQDTDHAGSDSAEALKKPLLRYPARLESVTPPPSFPTEYQPPFEPVGKPMPFTETHVESAESATNIDQPLAVVALEPVRHKIVDGDTLVALAAKYLGDGNRFGEIFQTNRDVLPGPDTLPIGAEIVIQIQ